jgi:sec-independent protein translocase protein TatB
MLNLGFGEIAIIAVLAIVVVGPDRLPEMLRYLGKQYGRVMRASNELRRAFMIEADREDAQKRAEGLRKRREQARKRAEEARKRALDRAKQLEGGEPVPRDLLDHPPTSDVHPVAVDGNKVNAAPPIIADTVPAPDSGPPAAAASPATPTAPADEGPA